MSDDIKQRLRAQAVDAELQRDADAMLDAADALDARDREIERLEARAAGLIRDCAEADGRIAELATERDGLKARVAEQREAVAALMIRHSMATGHGDTHQQLLWELETYIDGYKAHIAKQAAEIADLTKLLQDGWVEVADGPMSARMRKERDAARAEAEAMRAFYTGVMECKDDTWQCPRCGHAEDWWTDSNADYATRDARAAIDAARESSP